METTTTAPPSAQPDAIEGVPSTLIEAVSMTLRMIASEALAENSASPQERNGAKAAAAMFDSAATMVHGLHKCLTAIQHDLASTGTASIEAVANAAAILELADMPVMLPKLDGEEG